jgi:hypothetical protein
MAFPRVCSSVVGSNTPARYIVASASSRRLSVPEVAFFFFFFSSSFLWAFFRLWAVGRRAVTSNWRPCPRHAHFLSLCFGSETDQKSIQDEAHFFGLLFVLVGHAGIGLPPSFALPFHLCSTAMLFFGKAIHKKEKKNGVRRGTGSRSSMINMDLREQMFLCMGKRRTRFSTSNRAKWRKWINLCLFIP